MRPPGSVRAGGGQDLGAAAATGRGCLLGSPRLWSCLQRGAASPAWAGDITRELIAALPRSRVAVLPGQGHEAIGSAPEMLTSQLREFLAVP